ncbi:MAG: 16S rRNA (guanine(966)-N(2))-methyltransferase RsmD [Clostridia bacterium]|nr:16S rRNA (guanine(966)-N(2))-methyltransferase RsmD [Clostridia bacterium]
MRVISGSARGTPLKTIEGENTRPTTDKVKEAMFNVIQFDIAGARVLDAFAGSGALGIEALSRGASWAVFIEKNRAAAGMIKKNLIAAKLEKNAQIVTGDCYKYIKTYKGEPFDIVFLDPPYDREEVKNVFNELCTCNMLSDTAIILCETRREALPDRVGMFSRLKKYVYGNINVTVYTADKAEKTVSDLEESLQ